MYFAAYTERVMQYGNIIENENIPLFLYFIKILNLKMY